MEGDDFENIYKGEVSKSGIPILPSKRARKIPEKLEVSTKKEDQINIDNTEENLDESEKNEVSSKKLENNEKIEEEINEIKNPEISDS